MLLNMRLAKNFFDFVLPKFKLSIFLLCLLMFSGLNISCSGSGMSSSASSGKGDGLGGGTGDGTGALPGDGSGQPQIYQKIQLTGGYHHGCSRARTGEVYCWGENSKGQLGDSTKTRRLTPTKVLVIGTEAEKVVVGLSHSCALLRSKQIMCWGSNYYGELGIGSNADQSVPVAVDLSVIASNSRVVDVSAGLNFTCLLTESGLVYCWGRNQLGQLGEGSLVNRDRPSLVQGLSANVVKISSKDSHSCVINSNNALYCWGLNDFAQLGSAGGNSSLPLEVTSLAGVSVIQVAVASHHTCVLTNLGGVKCWGKNSVGQLGNSGNTDSVTPVDVTSLGSDVASIDAGAEHACAVRSSGELKCWGENLAGQVGDNTLVSRAAPVTATGLATGVESISLGYRHSCATTVDKKAYCWGFNASGQLGDGTATNSNLPSSVSGYSNGLTVAISGGHTCSVSKVGSVKCWGLNSSGQVGDGTMTQKSVPTDVTGLSSGVKKVVTSQASSCALLNSGGVKCWGSNGHGETGFGSGGFHTTPVNVSGMSSGVTDIVSGETHICALLTSGKVYCWGYNVRGELGDGSNTTRLTPVEVINLGFSPQSISAGDYFTCAVSSTGSGKCWGDNGNGQLGDGTTTHRNTPVDILAVSSGISALANGSNHSCALLSNGGLKCWGLNFVGQLGNGANAQSLVAVDVLGLQSGVVGVYAGGYNTCARTIGDELLCWGSNGNHQLGDGTDDSVKYSPVAVTGLSLVDKITSVSVGNASTCSVQMSGSIKCWGLNNTGQLGIDTNVALPRLVFEY